MYRCALNPWPCIIRWTTEILVIRCVRAAVGYRLLIIQVIAA